MYSANTPKKLPTYPPPPPRFRRPRCPDPRHAELPGRHAPGRQDDDHDARDGEQRRAAIPLHVRRAAGIRAAHQRDDAAPSRHQQRIGPATAALAAAAAGRTAIPATPHGRRISTIRAGDAGQHAWRRHDYERRDPDANPRRHAAAHAAVPAAASKRVSDPGYYDDDELPLPPRTLCP